jgi:hypothetical protein
MRSNGEDFHADSGAPNANSEYCALDEDRKAMLESSPNPMASASVKDRSA